jgi:peptide/nickel transport system ATP-binding protein
MKETILSTEKLNISYSAKQEKPTVRNMDFEIKRGEIIGLVGESGSGKSTFARAVIGMLPHISGKMEKNTNKIQMVFQDPFVYYRTFCGVHFQ